MSQLTAHYCKFCNFVRRQINNIYHFTDKLIDLTMDPKHK